MAVIESHTRNTVCINSLLLLLAYCSFKTIAIVFIMLDRIRLYPFAYGSYIRYNINSTGKNSVIVQNDDFCFVYFSDDIGFVTI